MLPAYPSFIPMENSYNFYNIKQVPQETSMVNKKISQTQVCQQALIESYRSVAPRSSSPATMSNSVFPRSASEALFDSNAKFRQLPCRTFISVGTCPYRERCVYLHDPRCICKEAKTKTRRKNKEDVVLDSLFWPVMPYPLVAEKLDNNRQPHVIQPYSVPLPQPDQYEKHDMAVYSMWMHFVDFCMANSDVANQGYNTVNSPCFQAPDEDRNSYTGVERLPLFKFLSRSEGRLLTQKDIRQLSYSTPTPPRLTNNGISSYGRVEVPNAFPQMSLDRRSPMMNDPYLFQRSLVETVPESTLGEAHWSHLVSPSFLEESTGKENGSGAIEEDRSTSPFASLSNVHMPPRMPVSDPWRPISSIQGSVMFPNQQTYMCTNSSPLTVSSASPITVTGLGSPADSFCDPRVVPMTPYQQQGVSNREKNGNTQDRSYDSRECDYTDCDSPFCSANVSGISGSATSFYSSDLTGKGNQMNGSLDDSALDMNNSNNGVGMWNFGQDFRPASSINFGQQ